jgi:hypothetical protein
VATLGTQYLIGAVFAAAPEKYHTVLNITSEMKCKALDIDDLEKVMYNIWRKGGGKPTYNNKEQYFFRSFHRNSFCLQRARAQVD